MRYFLIFLVLSVASCAPSGIGSGPTTVSPFGHSNGGGYYYNGGLNTIATFTGNTHGNGPCGGAHGGCGPSTIAPLSWHANGHFEGDHHGGISHSGSGHSALSVSNSGFGNGLGNSSLGNGLGNSGFGNGLGNSGFGNGLSNGHLTAGAINGALGGFTGGIVDGHLNAGLRGGLQTSFNNGFDGHLTAGGDTSGVGPGPDASSIIGSGGQIGGPFGGQIGGSIGGNGLSTGGLIGPIDGPSGTFGPIGSGGFDQGPIVTKDFYFHAAAEDNDDELYSKTVNLGPSRKHYRVVFIKAPSQSAKAAALQILQAKNEEKTVIYVLSKKTDAAEIHTQIQGQHSTPTKPEVFFIKYKTPEEAIHAQQQIQAQYDSLGGVSRFSDEGIAPVTSIIGSLGGSVDSGSHGGSLNGNGNFIGGVGPVLGTGPSAGAIGHGGPSIPRLIHHAASGESSLAAGGSILGSHGGSHSGSHGSGLFSGNHQAAIDNNHGGHDGPSRPALISGNHFAALDTSLSASSASHGGHGIAEGYLPPKH